MSEHAWVFESLTSYSAGGLEPAERERVEQHAAGCATCTRALAELRAVDETLDNLFAGVRPQPGFENRVLHKLRPSLGRPRFRFALRLSAAAAAVLFLGVVGAAMHGLAMQGRLPFPGIQVAVVDDSSSMKRLPPNLIQGHSDLARNYSVNGKVNLSELHDMMVTDADKEDLGLKYKFSIEESANKRSELGGRSYFGIVNAEKASKGREAAAFSPDGRRLATSGDQPAGGENNPSQPAQDSRVGGKPVTMWDYRGYGTGKTGRFGSGSTPSSPQVDYLRYSDETRKEDDYFRLPAQAALGQPTSPAPPTPPAANAPKRPEAKEGEGRDTNKPPNGEQKPGAEQAQPPTPEAAPGLKVIRTGEVEYEVDSFQDSVAVIKKVIGTIKGASVSTEKRQQRENKKWHGSVVVRVPPERLDGFLVALQKDLGKSAELKSQRIGSQDVTKQYMDIEARLNQAKVLEKRLLVLIEKGQGELKDVLAVERQLGEVRTKIEEMEGEIRYYNNLIALSTLTITLEEKSMQSPSALVTSESITMRIEVDDVDKSQKEALAVVSQHKGRVAKSELKQHAAGQLEAVLVFEVAPDVSGAVRNALSKLGTVTKQDAERLQQAEGGTGRPEDVKTRSKDVQFNVTLYNVANIEPRETFHLQLASNDVPAAFRKLKEAVAAAEGQVRKALLNEQDKLNISAELSFDIARKHEKVIEKLLAEVGEAFSRSTAQVPIGETATDKKVGYRLRLLSVSGVPPREKVTLELDVANVEETTATFVGMVRERKGEVARGPRRRLDATGRAIAEVLFDVPLSMKDDLLAKFRKAGRVRVDDSDRNPQVPESTLATAQIYVKLTSDGPIVPGDEALWPKIRTSLFYSFTLLSFSLMFIILGLSVVLPWALIIYGVVRLVRRFRRKAEAAA